ncbi:hypothetical protein F5X98DRAFT_374552 [Xylaria grammica]|nr:hypothetical protein F5X98DRAFT_374552 [Xylaria grammica]
MSPNKSFNSNDYRYHLQYRRFSKTSKPNEHTTDGESPNADTSVAFSFTFAFYIITPVPTAWQNRNIRPRASRTSLSSCFTSDWAYALLLHRFKAEGEQLLAYFKNKIRADWNATSCTLTLRLMPTHVHKGVQGKFQSALDKEIQRIANNYPQLQGLCAKLKSYIHADVKKNGLTKSPDGQLLFDGIKFPTFIFEVAYSQREKSLLETVTEYFDICEMCTVVTFDIEYVPSTHRKLGSCSTVSSVSLFTSKEDKENIIIQQVINRKIFRQEKQALPGELTIPFQLLLPWKERDCQSLPNVNLRFLFSELSDWVSKTEVRQQLQDATPSPPSHPRKRKYVDEDGKEVEGLGSSKRVALGAPSEAESEPRRSDRLRARAEVSK